MATGASVGLAAKKATSKLLFILPGLKATSFIQGTKVTNQMLYGE